MALINKKKFKSGVVNLLNNLKERIANQPQAIEDFATGLTNLLEKYAVGGNVIPDTDFGVLTVTGDGVDNTDPKNPVLIFPTAAEVGAYSTSQVDALIAIGQFIPPSDFTLTPDENNHTIANAGYDCTINPNTETYADKTVVAMKNITDSTDCDIVCRPAIGWTYKVNDNASVASGTFNFPNGATCTIIKFEGTNKIYIDGGVE